PDARDVLVKNDHVLIAAGAQGVLLMAASHESNTAQLLDEDPVPNLAASRLLTVEGGVIALYNDHMIHYQSPSTSPHQLTRVGSPYFLTAVSDQIAITSHSNRVYSLEEEDGQRLLRSIAYSASDAPQVLERFPVGASRQLAATDGCLLLAASTPDLIGLAPGHTATVNVFRNGDLDCDPLDSQPVDHQVAIAAGTCGVYLLDDQGLGQAQQIESDGFARSLAVGENALWVAMGSAGLLRLDRQDPTEPGIAFRPNASYAVDFRWIRIVDQVAYVIDDRGAAGSRIWGFPLSATPPYLDLDDAFYDNIISGGYPVFPITDLDVAHEVIALADGSSRIHLIRRRPSDGSLGRQRIYELDDRFELVRVDKIALDDERLYAAYQDDYDPMDCGLLELVLETSGADTIEVPDFHDLPWPHHRPQDVLIDGQTAILPYRSDWLNGIAAVDLGRQGELSLVGRVLTKEPVQWVTASDDYLHAGGDRRVGRLPKFQRLEVSVVPQAPDQLVVETPATVPAAGRYSLSAGDDQSLYAAVLFSANAELFSTQAVIVAGSTADSDYLGQEFKNVADAAYNTLMVNSFGDRVHYLCELWPYQTYVQPTLSALENALGQGVDDRTTQLILFLVGHGTNGRLQLRDNAADVLTVRHLDAMLDALQTERQVKRILVVLDACFSGSFIDDLEPPSSDVTRLVITSSTADGRAAYGDEGNGAFSMHFWQALEEAGTGIGSAFEAAAGQFSGSLQTPQICDYDSRHPTVADVTAAADQLCMLSGGTRYFLRPHIDFAAAILGDSSQPQLALEAGVVQADRVWFDLLSPIHLPEVYLAGEHSGHPLAQRPGMPNAYAGSVTLTDGPGTYVVSVRAAKRNQAFNLATEQMDPIEVYAAPWQVHVTSGSGENAAAADGFEPDDQAPAGAIAVINTAAPARHTFHRQDDVDGYWFYGLEGETYVLETLLQSTVCDPQLDLFDADGTFLLDATLNAGNLGEIERLQWECPADGLYRAEVSNAGETFGGPVNYALRIKKPDAPLAVTVTGQVLDRNRQPLSRVRIRTDDEMTALSHEDGDFLMLHRPGTFRMTCESEGFPARTLDVYFSEGSTNHIEVIMGEPSDPDPSKKQPGSGGGSGGGGCFLGSLTTDHRS
nr:C13 family peptidase [Desulfosarcinaceae bacterium]